MKHLKKYKIFESLVGEDLEFKLLCKILDTRMKKYSNAPLLKPIIPNIIIGGKSYKTTVLLRDRESDVFSCIDRWVSDNYNECILDMNEYKKLKNGLFKWFEQTFGMNPILFIDKLQEMSDEYEISVSDILGDEEEYIQLSVDGKIDFSIDTPYRNGSLSSIESFFNDFSNMMDKEWTPTELNVSDGRLNATIRLL